MIPYSRQSLAPEDIEAVVDVLRSDFLTQGPLPGRFEAALATYCGSRHAVAVSHGTAALHLACAAIDLGPGDLLWTSAITFVASANCGRYCGADVDFVDVDPASGLIDIGALAAKLLGAERDGRLPAVLIPVHFAGQCCDMTAIQDLAKRYGFRVIEDACHALGARHRGAAAGSCRWSDMAVFSFHPVKSIATGEGGAVTTNDAALAARLRLLASHGITRDPAQLERPDEGGWYYEQVALGWNYRITDMQAALGLSQMQRLDRMVQARRDRAARYHAALASLPLALPRHEPHDESAWHLYVVQLAGAELRRTVYEALRADGIGAQVHYIPVHLQPYYRRRDFKPGDFPAAEAYYRGALSLPLYPTLTQEDQDRVIASLATAVGVRHKTGTRTG
jgi:UDP-4-amino-4,6-dideoxy-N-acetyl-beta-L-altrosamine transaminase